MVVNTVLEVQSRKKREARLMVTKVVAPVAAGLLSLVLGDLT